MCNRGNEEEEAEEVDDLCFLKNFMSYIYLLLRMQSDIFFNILHIGHKDLIRGRVGKGGEGLHKQQELQPR